MKDVTLPLLFIFVCLSLLLALGCSQKKDSAKLKNAIEAKISFKNASQTMESIVGCKRVNNDLPQDLTDNFLVSDTIYLYLTWKNLTGENQVTISWYTPRGTLQDQTSYTFHSDGGTSNTWHFLRLFDNQSQLEKFVGEWTAKIILNGNFAAEKKFKVRYP